MRLRFLGVVLAACLVAGGVFLYSGGYVDGMVPTRGTAVKKKGGAPVPVIVAAAESRTVPVSIETIGQIQAYATVAVKSRVDGQVMETFFRDGQMVKKGDPLFRIDPRPLQAKVQEVEANLARDRAQLANARADLERYAKLSQSGYSSQQRYDLARATSEALEAAVKANTAALERAKLDLSFTAINAPIEGRVGSVLVDPGNLVKANDGATLVVINQVKPIYVSFSVPEQHLPEIKRRMADGAVMVEVRVPGADSTPERGRVVFVNNAVDATTGTIQLKAEIANDREELTPGQFVRVALVMREIANAVVVPAQAVQNGQDGPFVYVIDGNRRAVLRNVTVGPQWRDLAVIEKGVAAGETVVSEGHLRLRPNARVAIKDDKPGEGQRGGDKTEPGS